MTPADKILRKALVASPIPSSQWEGIRAQLRDRAFFSARIESVRFLAAARSAVADLLAENPTLRGTVTSREDAIRAIRHAAMAEGLDRRDLRALLNPASRERARLIVDTNAGLAAGFVRHLADSSPGALAAFPARELVRLPQSNPRVPRDWPTRWRNAGGGFFQGRMIALAADPVWSRISRFGLPYPPFDFNSGMTTRQVSASEALSLGVIDDRFTPPQTPPEPSFNASLNADVQIPHDSTEAQALLAAFGDQAVLNGDVFMWRGELIRDVVSGKARSARLGRGFDGRNLRISHDYFQRHEKDPLTSEDYELLPTIWRSPDRVFKDARGHVLELDALDGGVYALVVDSDNGLSDFYKKTKDAGEAWR